MRSSPRLDELGPEPASRTDLDPVGTVTAWAASTLLILASGLLWLAATR